MTAKVGRSQWDSHLINQYRQERNEARAENERLQAELDLALTKLRYTLAALEKVMTYQLICPVCKRSQVTVDHWDVDVLEREPIHDVDCIVGLVQSMEPVDIGEKTEVDDGAG